MNKVFYKAKKRIGKAAGAAVGALGIASVFPADVFADTTVDGADDTVKGIIKVILRIFRYIGIILAVWGVGQLVTAFRNDDADSKTRAVMLIMASIALISLQALLSLIPTVSTYVAD